MLLRDKHILVTGVMSESSIGTQVARLAQEEGASLIVTAHPQILRAAERVVKRLGIKAPIVPLDVTSDADVAGLTRFIESEWVRVDGSVHSIGFAPPRCFGNTMLEARWEDVAQAMHTSCFSLRTLVDVARPLMTEGGAVVALSVDTDQAWPHYDWMGVVKGALETLARYLARDLGPAGIRVNVVRAGPVRTVASRSVPNLLSQLGALWANRAPLGWDTSDCTEVAQMCVLLLSDWMRKTTGEIVHVDGGMHAVGAGEQPAAPVRLPDAVTGVGSGQR